MEDEKKVKINHNNMHPKVKKAFQVSDGLASLVHKKISGFVKELEVEHVLTKEEGSKVLKGLTDVKKALYDSVSGELKKILSEKTKQVSKKKRV